MGPLPVSAGLDAVLAARGLGGLAKAAMRPASTTRRVEVALKVVVSRLK
jgi:hypothetical protein